MNKGTLCSNLGRQSAIGLEERGSGRDREQRLRRAWLARDDVDRLELGGDVKDGAGQWNHLEWIVGMVDGPERRNRARVALFHPRQRRGAFERLSVRSSRRGCRDGRRLEFLSMEPLERRRPQEEAATTIQFSSGFLEKTVAEEGHCESGEGHQRGPSGDGFFPALARKTVEELVAGCGADGRLQGGGQVATPDSDGGGALWGSSWGKMIVDGGRQQRD